MAQTTNIASILDDAAARWPDAVALLYRDDALTFGAVRRQADRIAAALSARGVGPGGTVAMLAPNTPEFVCAYFGILKTGAAVLPINPLTLPRTVPAQMRLCGAEELLLYPGLDRPELREALAGLRITEVVLPEEMPDTPFETVYREAEAVAVRLFTSGTTGAAKAAELSHYNLLFNAFLFRDALGCRAGDRVLACLPLAYGIGQTGLLNVPFIAGSSVVLQAVFNPEEALALIERHRVCSMIGVPTVYRKMLDAAPAGCANLFGEYWRVACIGGAPVPSALWAEVEERFGPRVFIGYGLSETSPLACWTSLGTPPTAHLVGRPPVGIDLSVRDAAGVALGAGEAGELWIRGHNVGLGYLVEEDAPAPDAFGREWFRTGDVARIDADGAVYILGRFKDIIIRSGHKINPAEVEQTLARHPAITAVSVLGVPDQVTGEEIVACVVLAPGAESTSDEIAAWAREALPAQAYPRRVFIMDVFPVGPTGKVLKSALRQHVEQL